MEERDRQLERMSVGDILDYSVEVYKRNFKKLTLLSLIFFVPFIVVYTVATSYLAAELPDVAEIGSFAGNPSELTYRLMAYYLMAMLMGLVYFIYSITLQPVMEAAVIRIVYSDVVYGREQDFKEAIKEGFKRFPGLVANKFLYGLIVLGAVLGGYVLFFIFILLILLGTGPLGSSFFVNANPVGSTIMTIIAGFFFLVLFLAIGLLVAWFALKFGFGLSAVVVENKGPVEALTRSWRLSKENFWNLFFSSIFGAMLLFTVPSLLSTAVTLLMAVDSTFYILSAIAAEVLGSLLYPYLTVLFTMLFINLKIKKEGLDLEVRVDKLIEAQKREEQIDGERRTGDYGA